MIQSAFLKFVLATVISVALAAAVSSCGKSNTKTVAGLIMVKIPGEEYYMGTTEVTQKQWESIMGRNPSEFKGANLPVENVSWDDCNDFLDEFNELPEVKKTGLFFRLPTEEEWAYACRAGGKGEYGRMVNGSNITEDTLGEVAWFKDNAEGKTHPVGQKKPNAFGLYDMLGNVSEWMQNDMFGRRSCRGGDYSDWDCDIENVSVEATYGTSSHIGFRLCAETIMEK